MEMISVENHGKVMFAKLNRGVSNALNPKVVKELEAVLKQVSPSSTI